jgi:arylsulfatase A-like enzyme
MIARWRNGIAQAGLTIAHIVEAVDVLPTLLQWAGIPIPAHLQGAPLPTSNDPGARTKVSAVLEASQGKSLRTERYRYVVRVNGQEALYDLTKDLGEYLDVAKDPAYAGALSEMRGEMVRRMLQMERPLPRTWPY